MLCDCWWWLVFGGAADAVLLLCGMFFSMKSKIFLENKKEFLYLHPAIDAESSYKMIAQMAELVDALDSKSCFRKGVQVRFLFWALFKARKCLYL